MCWKHGQARWVDGQWGKWILSFLCMMDPITGRHAVRKDRSTKFSYVVFVRATIRPHLLLPGASYIPHNYTPAVGALTHPR